MTVIQILQQSVNSCSACKNYSGSTGITFTLKMLPFLKFKRIMKAGSECCA